MSNKSESVRVCVRIRPLNSKEKQDGRTEVVFAKKDRGEISVKNPTSDDREPPKTFTFDSAFPPGTAQIDVYNQAATDIVDCVLDGFNGTIFAYGQTGAGKSHTMEGYNDPPELRGIIPNSFKHIFDKVQVLENKQFLVRASYLEIYNEEIRDLLSKDPKNRLELKENMDTGIYVKDLTSMVVKDVAEIDHVMQMGKKNRSVGSTLMNQTSSRSHSMFAIIVECSSIGVDGKDHICMGKLNLVDLAGSERQSKTGATGDRLKEATKINLSLSALGNVISALVDGKSQHIPYRDSKLTRLLQDSLGGNAKTVMIANCGPADYNYDETLSTLRYANRAKNIKNKPKINEDPKDAMLREYQEEIQKLKEQLQAQEKGITTQMIDGKEVRVAAPQIREKLVEKVIVKREGVSEEELKKLEEDARREKVELQKKAQAEMKALLAEQNRTEEEREKLEEQLKIKAEEKKSMEKDRKNMLQNLAKMEEKLIMGGKIMDKASKQESKLREAQLKLEEQKRQELQLARELAERDDSNLLLEEQHASLQDEVDVKTKKLKKLWAKHKAAVTEIDDLKSEFQAEKEDMLDTIRELTRQLKLKQILSDNFVPLEETAKLEKRATWDEESDDWKLDRLISLNSVSSMKPRRPVSIYGVRRPETEYAKRNKQLDNNPRWKIENVICLDLDMPERTTQDYESCIKHVGLHSLDKVRHAICTSLENEDEYVYFEGEPVQPLKSAETEAKSNSDEEVKEKRKERPKSSVKRSNKNRPGTASRRRREANDA